MLSLSGPDSAARSNAILRLGAELHDGGGWTGGHKVFDTLHADKCEYKKEDILSDVFHMPSVVDALSCPSQTEWHPLLAASLRLWLDTTMYRTVPPAWRNDDE